ncbi:unnamed protein product [Prorocentrum cordatum]|uniref:Uncharacterized protein n=1 Tax=Prorocentrum cordatum TaxID=2364126 RepID=A0ABN9WSJ2_9DINO|nr:unnamed protein product [Polarella glacialis]
MEAGPGRRWLIVGCKGDGEVNVLADFDSCEWFMVYDTLGVAKAGGKCFLVKSVTEKQAERSLDARVLRILIGFDGDRRRVFKDAVRGMSETDAHPRAMRSKSRAECGLSAIDAGVSEHELAMRALELGATFDQLSLTELALAGLLCLEDECLYMGTSETREFLMVRPLLVDHIQAGPRKVATLMKEKRKLREERMLSRGQGFASDGDGNKALRDKVAAQAVEISRLQAQVKGPQAASMPDEAAGPLESMVVARELLPCPVPVPGRPPDGGCCRAVRSRARRRQYVGQWLSAALHAVNKFIVRPWCFPTGSPGVVLPGRRH